MNTRVREQPYFWTTFFYFHGYLSALVAAGYAVYTALFYFFGRDYIATVDGLTYLIAGAISAIMFLSAGYLLKNKGLAVEFRADWVLISLIIYPVLLNIAVAIVGLFVYGVYALAAG